VPDWRKGPAPRDEQELFNHLHSSIRIVIERSFGVWKMKWRILLSMPSYPMDKQKMIVAVTMDFITSFMRIMQMIKILENVIGIRIMCRLYHQDIEDIMSPKMQEIHPLRKLMIGL
jgi:hypothetical protein